ncbi:MAG TPA: hypothetical protein VF444_16990 [Pseudonocardiaceae bacterium]
MTDEREALAEFPELRRLIDLKHAGWTFLPTTVDGEVTELHGIRGWPQGWADAMRVRYLTDAAAVRCDYTGAITWRCEGTLTDVIDGLLCLPAPGDRLAPRLVIDAGPALWTP